MQVQDCVCVLLYCTSASTQTWVLVKGLCHARMKRAVAILRMVATTARVAVAGGE